MLLTGDVPFKMPWNKRTFTNIPEEDVKKACTYIKNLSYGKPIKNTNRVIRIKRPMADMLKKYLPYREEVEKLKNGRISCKIIFEAETIKILFEHLQLSVKKYTGMYSEMQDLAEKTIKELMNLIKVKKLDIPTDILESILTDINVQKTALKLALWFEYNNRSDIARHIKHIVGKYYSI